VKDELEAALRDVRGRMAPGARLMMVERVGGRSGRTMGEMERVLRVAGFTMETCTPLEKSYRLIEASAAPRGRT